MILLGNYSWSQTAKAQTSQGTGLAFAKDCTMFDSCPLFFVFTLLSGPHSHLLWRAQAYVFSEQSRETPPTSVT